MRKHPRIFFWSILILTVLAVTINLPKSLNIHFSTPKLPFINKEISVQQDISSLRPDSFFRQIGINRNLDFQKGLDLEGGTSITLRADMKAVGSAARSDALEGAKAVIERRVNFFGVSEPVIQTASKGDDYRIIVELPGVTDVDQAVKLIGTTAQLSFWEDGASESGKLATPSAGTPLGLETIFSNPKKTNLTGADLEKATVGFSPQTSQPEVQLLFTPNGAKKFADITKRNVGKRVAIALDDQVVEAPQVQQAITGGSAVISGTFTTDTAKALGIQLNAGALPVPLSVLEQRTIGPTLGLVSLQKSLFAGVLGFVALVIFMCVFYKQLGMIASVALLLYTLFALAIFKLVPVTLTLAGIAGFILSIGMAVDANVLIFERMREELRRGKSREAAMELGFSRAWTSIRDSNISSLITCIILYYFGSGIIRGFALTLALGILISMFSAIVVTRTFLRVVYK